MKLNSNVGGLMICVSAIISAQSQPVVWTAGSLQRIAKDAAPGSSQSASIAAGRGEYESFQIIVTAPAGDLSNINVTLSNLTGPGGSVIPASNFTLYRENYVLVHHASPDEYGFGNRSQGAGWYPDGLIPFADPSTGASLSGAALQAVPFNLAANNSQPIWIDLLVPRSAQPGLYNGLATVTSNQGNATVPISVKVWNFTLPLQPSLKSSFGSHAPLNTDVKLHQLLLQHRLMPTLVNPGDSAALVSQGLSTTNLWFFSNSSRSNCSMGAAPPVAEIQAQLARYSGITSAYIYSADEIDGCSNLYSTVQQWGRNMHLANPRINNLITMTPTPSLFDDGAGTGRSAVDMWVLLPKMYNAAPSLVAQALAKGDQVWSYNTLTQDSYSPKWEIDFSPVNYRIQPGFINQSLSLTGLLYWRVDLFSSDPWNNVEAYTDSKGTYPGEGMLVYPGAQVGVSGVAPSMRLKYLRDGVDDYDYVQLLKAAGLGDWALSVARGVGANWSSWTNDPAQVEAARTALGERLDQLNGGGVTAPSCSYSLNALTTSAPAGASSLTVLLNASSSSCPWTAASNQAWITLGSASGSGSQAVTLNITPNAGPARTGAVVIGGITLQITQAAAAPAGCFFALSTMAAPASSGASSLSVFLIASSSSCAWSVTSNQAWITVASAASGSGSQGITLNIAPNSGAARTGTVVIGGVTLQVAQAAATPGCSFSLSASSLSSRGWASKLSVAIIASSPGCAWSTSSDQPWITLGPQAGRGSGIVTVSLDQNSGSTRNGNVTIGGAPLQVIQR